jgi:hypothetical protein
VSQRRFVHNSGRLWALAALAIVCLGWLRYWPALSGSRLVEGSLGVLLGLFICSNPAGNAVDMFFFERGALRRATTEWGSLGWLALNLLVLLLGWLVIFMGAIRFAMPGA